MKTIIIEYLPLVIGVGLLYTAYAKKIKNPTANMAMTILGTGAIGAEAAKLYSKFA